ncbi:unnamed protein product [Bursaphelenchus okinawaensis]|uniref:Uncharacterized protein n=1 Tax=Bursaphelenchus okinawaensis TaxID=465554 RepID=A0A811KKN5_9BILA|nr:unnamed protein product [Bursaphelenchus okinawaensis]CAG9105210.1 unnamed protein product [Bursaphelenchus okinawaensis]
MPPTDLCTEAESSTVYSFGSPLSMSSQHKPLGIQSQDDYLRLKMVYKVKKQEYEKYVCHLWLQRAQAENEKNMRAMQQYFQNKQSPYSQ